MQKRNKRSKVQQSKRNGVRKVSEMKMFITRKYVMAKSASDAIKRDSKTPVHDCWIDDDWKNGKSNQLSTAIGFDNGMKDEDEV